MSSSLTQIRTCLNSCRRASSSQPSNSLIMLRYKRQFQPLKLPKVFMLKDRLLTISIIALKMTNKNNSQIRNSRSMMRRWTKRRSSTMKKKRTTKVTMRVTKPITELTKPPRLGSKIVTFRCVAEVAQLKKRKRQNMTSNSHCFRLLMKMILIMLMDNNRCPLSYSSKSLLRLAEKA